MVVSVVLTMLYLWFTADIALEGVGQNGGMRQAAYRYGGMSIAVFVLQGLLYILNSGVMSILEPGSDGAADDAAAACLRIASVNTKFIMALTVGALAGGRPSPPR